MPSLLEVKKKLLRLKMENSFYLFFKAAWSTMDQTNELIPSWHYEYMCEWIDYAESGKMQQEDPLKHLVYFCVPPGTSKSLMCSVALPCWKIAKDPSQRVATISHGDDIMVPMSVKRRDLIQSDFYRGYWPEVKIKGDANLKTRQDTTAGGYLLGTTRKAGITGVRLSMIVMDDLLKVVEAYSDPFRKEANDLYPATLLTRLSRPRKDYLIGISQRLHPMDIVGHLQEKYRGHCHFIVVPMECEEDTEYRFPVSGRVYKRKKGDILLPELFPESRLAPFRSTPLEWARQMQQRPSPLGGIIFPTDKWRVYKEVPSFECKVLSVDAAMKDKPENDFSAIHVYGIYGSHRFLLDRKTAHMNFPALEKAILEMCARWNPEYKLIEDKANGTAVIQRLQDTVTGIIAIDPEGGKVSRAQSAAAALYGENIHVPDPAVFDWVQPMIDNFSLYNGEGSVEHDDDIDAFTQMVNWTAKIFSGAQTWLDAKYAEIQSESKNGTIPDTSFCPVCKGHLSYMSGVWSCSKGHARGDDNTRRVTRVGF